MRRIDGWLVKYIILRLLSRLYCGAFASSRRRQSWIVPCCRARVVVDEVFTPHGRYAHFPAGGQRAQCGAVIEAVGAEAELGRGSV